MMIPGGFVALIARAFDSATMRAAFRVLGLGLLAGVLLGTLARGAAEAESDVGTLDDGIEAAAAEPEEPEEPRGSPPPDSEARVEYFIGAARYHWFRGNRPEAERAYAMALHEDVPIESKRDLLLDLERFYAEDGAHVKVIAVLEKFRLAFGTDPELPAVLMRLGLAYRELGAMDLATARFYQVLNSTLSIRPDELEAFRGLAMKARLEIAEILLLQGKTDEAGRLYARLQVLDLEPADRERVRFRSAQLQHALKQWRQAADQLGVFVREYPDGRFTPEARHLRARALNEMGRKEDAVQEVIELLASVPPEDSTQAQVMAYWKRRTANELANQYYEQGDFHGALVIYQALARAGAEPGWRWPAVYQVGLCFERLAMPARAAEAYRLILSPEGAPKAGVGVPGALASLQGMAKWRLEHLDWVEDFGQRIQVLTAESSAGS